MFLTFFPGNIFYLLFFIVFCIRLVLQRMLQYTILNASASSLLFTFGLSLCALLIEFLLFDMQEIDSIFLRDTFSDAKQLKIVFTVAFIAIQLNVAINLWFFSPYIVHNTHYLYYLFGFSTIACFAFNYS